MKSVVKAIGRCLIVATTICAWLTISNHCAFRALGSKTVSRQSVCPYHSSPAKPHPEPSGMECCKILRATLNATPASFAPAVADLSRAAVAQVGIFARPDISFTRATLDTGPPGKTSFTELNRSMRAQAPPSLA